MSKEYIYRTQNGTVLGKDYVWAWIEDFYQHAERNLRNYKRPSDFLERAVRILKLELINPIKGP